MRVDLHIHSYFSDGKYAPSKIIAQAVRHQLDIIALTDHDTIVGLKEAEQSIQDKTEICLIPGVEFSTFLEEHELHILGYGMDITHPVMIRLLEQVHRDRLRRVKGILERLKPLGISLTIDQIKNGKISSSLGRVHIARSMVKFGYVRTIREAFDRFLGDEAGILTYSETDFVSSQHVIETILQAGGIPVFAHPTITLFDRYINTLVDAGLKGVEVFKGSRRAIDEFYFETVVKDKGLFLTGGSDWHGHSSIPKLGSFYVDSTKIEPFLGALDCVPDELLL